MPSCHHAIIIIIIIILIMIIIMMSSSSSWCHHHHDVVIAIVIIIIIITIIIIIIIFIIIGFVRTVVCGTPSKFQIAGWANPVVPFVFPGRSPSAGNGLWSGAHCSARRGAWNLGLFGFRLYIQETTILKNCFQILPAIDRRESLMKNIEFALRTL